MIQIAEIILGLSCFAVFFVLYGFILPRMLHTHMWHRQGANVLGVFSIYLGFEAMAPASFIDAYYWGYLVGNSLFPLGCIMIAFSYWRHVAR
jgi:hypothetical protein